MCGERALIVAHFSPPQKGGGVWGGGGGGKKKKRGPKGKGVGWILSRERGQKKGGKGIKILLTQGCRLWPTTPLVTDVTWPDRGG